MAAPTPTNDTFKFTQIIGMNQQMIEYAKMTILFAFHDYPESDYDKAVFVKDKFKEKYGGIWTCCFIKNGQIGTDYFEYWAHIEYNNYGISIWKSSL